MSLQTYDVLYAYPDHGYTRAVELEKRIDDNLMALAARFHVPKPDWLWTAINTHFEPLEQLILISDYIVDIFNKRPEYRDDVFKLVDWEATHEFKHYLDNYRFQMGDPRGRKVIRHIERKRLLKIWFDLHGTVPTFEEDAVMFAAKVTTLSESGYDRLYNKLQPWNILGYTLP